MEREVVTELRSLEILNEELRQAPDCEDQELRVRRRYPPRERNRRVQELQVGV